MLRVELQKSIDNIIKDKDKTADVMKVFDGYLGGLPEDEFCRSYKLEHGSVCRYHCKFFDWSTGSCKWTEEQSSHPIKLS